MTASTQPTILIIDDDATIGRSLKRLSEQSFPGFQVFWAKNGVTGLDLARQYAEKALAILASHKVPASSWTDTDEYRGEIRRGAQKTLNQLSEKQG